VPSRHGQSVSSRWMQVAGFLLGSSVLRGHATQVPTHKRNRAVTAPAPPLSFFRSLQALTSLPAVIVATQPLSAASLFPISTTPPSLRESAHNFVRIFPALGNFSSLLAAWNPPSGVLLPGVQLSAAAHGPFHAGRVVILILLIGRPLAIRAHFPFSRRASPAGQKKTPSPTICAFYSCSPVRRPATVPHPPGGSRLHKQSRQSRAHPLCRPGFFNQSPPPFSQSLNHRTGLIQRFPHLRARWAQTTIPSSQRHASNKKWCPA